MLSTGFWKNLQAPIIGLSPMDGVTDAACRYITAQHGQPAVVFTEFTAVEGLRAGADRLLQDFYYHPTERPVVAQLFGSDPDAFFSAAAIASALGFDGIDINMGCPAKNVTERGAGAALIRDPERARAIVRATQAGTQAWADGAPLMDLGVHERLLPLIEERITATEQIEGKKFDRTALPVSLKTRIGYDTISIEEWIAELLPVEPVAITIHGRTLKQLYTGSADWDAIARGIAAGHGTPTIFLGNGDVLSLEDGLSKMKNAGADGFLIGRHAIGNPWIFQGHTPTNEERRAVTREHARYLHTIFPDGRAFVRIRKHLLEYTKDFPGAKEVRKKLGTIHTLSDVEAVLDTLE